MMFIWTLINTLSMLEFLPLLNINLPPIVFKVFDGLRVSQYDFLPFNRFLDKVTN